MNTEREKELFLAGFAIESLDERVAFLDQACAGDSELRRRVDALLEAQRENRSFLETPAGMAVTIAAPEITEHPGDTIGPYKLLQQIGEGGMGTVFMSEQSVPVERRVALKVIKPGMDTRQVIARFEAERQVLAMMDHPNIAKVLDAGTTEAGRPYFVMELVKGVPITQYCDEQQLAPRKRLELFLAVCQAVQHAHQKGIIHRDLKPSNILVAQYDDRAVPKIIDFGVAKAINQRLTEKTMFTQYGQIVGTIHYMSPEQAHFNQLDVDTRSDIYSLGVLLYELLTGETPFDKQRLQSVAFDELLRTIREEEPPRPSTRLSVSATLPSVAVNRRMEPGKLGALVRGELDWVVMKALEKDRARRYESASEFAEDVRRYLNDEPVAACPPTKMYRLRKSVQRNRTLFAIACATVTFLLLATVGLTIGTLLVLASRNEALRQSRYAREQSDIARENEQRVLERERTIGIYLYAADIRLASQAYENGDIAAVKERLHRHIPQSGLPDNRDFAWHYLWDLCRDSGTSQPRHRQAIYHVVYSPDGTLLATASDDQSVLITHVSDNSPCCELRDFADDVNGLAFSSDGKLLATAEEDRKVRVWEIPDGRETVRLTGFQQPVSRVFFTKDQAMLIAAEVDWGTNEGRVTLWNLATRKLVNLIDGYRGLDFHAETNRLAACTPDGGLSVWSLPELKQIASWKIHQGHVICAAFDAGGVQLVTGYRGGRLTYRQVVDQWGLELPGGHSNRTIRAVAFTSDGLTVVSGSDDGIVKIWDVKTGTLQRVLKAPSGVWSVALSPDGTRLVAGCEDGSIRTWGWNQLTLSRRRIVKVPYAPPMAAIDPDSRRVALVKPRSRSPEVNVFDATTGSPDTDIIEPDGNSPFAVSFGPDGKTLWITNVEGVVRQIDLGNGALRRTLKLHDKIVEMMRVSPNGRFLATSSPFDAKHPFRIWDVQGECDLVVVPAPTAGQPILRVPVAFINNQSLLAGFAQDVLAWDLNTGAPGKQSFQESSWVCSLALSPDGRTIAVGTDDAHVHLRDAASYRRQATFSGFHGAVRNLAFSPDGILLACASDRRELRTWHLPTHQLLLDLEGFGENVPALAFSRDGRRLIAAGALGDYHGEVVVWGESPERPSE